MKKRLLSIEAKEQFLDLCTKGIFLPGERIPSESEMSKRFGISRETWRSTLELLRREGVLYSKHGAGTYLLEPAHKIENDLSELRSLSEMIRNAGIVELTPKLSISHKLPTTEIAQMLRISPEEPVCVTTRTRYSETGTICSSINYMTKNLADGIDPGNPPSSIFSYFEKNKDIFITRSASNIAVPDADDPIIEELRKSVDVPILCLKQLHFDSRGNPSMYSIDYLRCDLFEFSVTRIRQR